MSWVIGWDSRFGGRDIGYGVPAYCDYPECNEEINRGLSFVCANSEPYGGEHGCGLYFCGAHHRFDDINCCERCSQNKPPFIPKPDHPDWISHKLTDESWQQWRNENPAKVQELKRQAIELSQPKEDL